MIMKEFCIFWGAIDSNSYGKRRRREIMQIYYLYNVNNANFQNVTMSKWLGISLQQKTHEYKYAFDHEPKYIFNNTKMVH